MSKSGILDALKDEEKSLRTQLVAIQRAIEAIEGADAPAPAGRGKKKVLKVVAKRKRTMTEEQRQAVADRMAEVLGIAARVQGAGVTRRAPVVLAAGSFQQARRDAVDSDRRIRIGRSSVLTGAMSPGATVASR